MFLFKKIPKLRDVHVELKKEALAQIKMRSTTKNVRYIGWDGFKNLGDEALLTAHKLLFPDLQFISEGRLIEFKIRSSFEFLSFPPRAIFLGGGTLINESKNWLQRLDHYGENKFIKIAFGTGVFGGSGLKEWKYRLNEFSFLGVRGPISYAHLAKAGIRNVQITGESVLSLAPTDVVVTPSSGTIGINIGFPKKLVRETVRYEYLVQMISLIKQFIGIGLFVKLLPVCSEDLYISKLILKKIGNANCAISNKYNNHNEFYKSIQNCDLVIAHKLHAGILSFNCRKPILQIEYQSKCADFMQSVALEKYIIKMETFNAQSVFKKSLKLLGEREYLSQHSEEQIKKYRSIQSEFSQIISEKYFAQN
jgi:hypothetical protein